MKRRKWHTKTQSRRIDDNRTNYGGNECTLVMYLDDNIIHRKWLRSRCAVHKLNKFVFTLHQLQLHYFFCCCCCCFSCCCNLCPEGICRCDRLALAGKVQSWHIHRCCLSNHCALVLDIVIERMLHQTYVRECQLDQRC